ncbi:MAG: hypothetical protein ABIJ11_06320 [Elusimicrobiota bacterium]
MILLRLGYYEIASHYAPTGLVVAMTDQRGFSTLSLYKIRE